MSSSIYWRPVPSDGQWVDKAIWYALNAHDEDRVEVRILDAGHIDLLRAFAIGNIAGAQELIDAIRKHGEIELREVY